MKILGEEEHGKNSKDTNIHNNQGQEHNNWYHRENNNNSRYPQHNTNQNNNSRQANNWYNKGLPREDNNNTRHQNHDERNKQQINQVRVNEQPTEMDEEKINHPTTHSINSIPANGKPVSPYIHCKIEGDSIQLLVDRCNNQCFDERNCRSGHTELQSNTNTTSQRSTNK